jgi:integrase/recombinase XerD
MTALAPTLQAFFVSRLGRQRDVSPHTVDSYRHAFRLLLAYAQTQTGKRPSEMDLADLDAVVVSGFLDYLEEDRGSSVASRNTRLAAIHSFFRFASYRHPEHAETIHQLLAIPRKKTQSTPRSFLTSAEMDALAAAPDLLHVVWASRPRAARRGAADRSSPLGAHRAALPGRRARRRRTHQLPGQGRKRRDTPLDRATVVLLRSWLDERRGELDDALFPSRRGGRLSPDAVQRLVAKHVTTARATCPSLANKQVSTHNLRHSCAMDLLRNGLDVAVLAIWLGHEKLESVNAYIHADPTLKERALDRLTPLNPAAKPGRYKPTDELLAFLESI